MKQLAERARQGDGDAFAEAVTEMQASLYRIARAYLVSESDIADALQETILNGWKNISGLKQPEYFRTWMIRILIRECLKIQKKNRYEIPYEESFQKEDGAGEKTISFAQRASERKEWQPGYGLEFEDMMRLLDEPVRKIFVLYYGEGYSTAEIAGLLGISEAAVRQRLSRGRREIKEKYYRKGAAR